MSQLLNPGLLFGLFVTILLPGLALAAGEGAEHTRLDLTQSNVDITTFQRMITLVHMFIGGIQRQ